MIHQSTGPTRTEERINAAALHAHKLQSCARVLMWALVPPFLIFIVFAVLNKNHGFTGIQTLVLGVSLLPGLGAIGWMVVEQSGLRKEFHGLGSSFTPGQGDVRQIAPPSSIGPLLEGTLAASTITSAWDHKDIDAATALLGSLLQFVRPEDAVSLTEEQRKRLEELVKPGRGDSVFSGGGVGGKNTVALQTLRNNLSPVAVRALGVLGNSASVPVLEGFARKTEDADLRAAALQSIEQIQQRAQ